MISLLYCVYIYIYIYIYINRPVVLTPRHRNDAIDDDDDDAIPSLLWKRNVRQTRSHKPPVHRLTHQRTGCGHTTHYHVQSLHDTPTTQHGRSRARVTDMQDIWSHTDISISWWTRLHSAAKCQHSLNVSHIQVTQPTHPQLSPVTVCLSVWVISIFCPTKLEQAGTCERRVVWAWLRVTRHFNFWAGHSTFTEFS